MKRLFNIIAVSAALLLAAGCYDDSAVNGRLDELESRVSALSDLGDDLMTISRLAARIEKRSLITSVTEENGGYRVIFSDGGSEFIAGGAEGATGDPGAPGASGESGEVGPEGSMPVISVRYADGAYWWASNDEFILDPSGNRLSASGTAPMVKIESGMLLASFDGGVSWRTMGSASSDVDSSIFESFIKTDNSVIIKLVGGSVMEFPISGKFTLTMDESPVECAAGDVIEVAYSVFGAENPVVCCHSEGGYVGEIIDATPEGGKVRIEVTNSTRGGKMMVFATDGDNTLMRSFEIHQAVFEPAVALKCDPIVTYASVAFKYAIENVPEGSAAVTGVCWAEKADPTTADNCLPCMDCTLDPVYQIVPATLLKLGTKYHFRCYIIVDGNTYYTKDYETALADQPAAITFNWTAEPASASFPSSVKVYKTTDQLNGYPFNAWYAIADPSDIECRVNLEQGTLKTLETQYAEDPDTDKPLVLVNGGYFYENTAVGRCYQNGNASTILYDVAGPDGARYNVTRGILGFETSGKASSRWCYANQMVDSPMPNVTGQPSYKAPSEYGWAKSYSWTPQNGISAGPMLLKDGKVLPEFTKMDNGYFLNNYEMIAADIFSGHGSDTDRTAIGFTSDGKVILFVCDGRCNASQGADLDQLACIMKGLGCVDALNLDGGGSTAMLVGGARVNTTVCNYEGSTENRKVATNIGFYVREQIPAVFFGTSVVYWWGQTSRDYEGNTYYFHPAFFTGNNFVNKGVAGDTMDKMAARHQADVIDLHPKIVVYEGNCNDLARGKTPDYVVGEFKKMAQASIAAGIIPILTTKTPNNWAGRSEYIPELNTKLKALATELGVAIVDIYPLFLDGSGNMDESLFVDGLHPNMAGYQKYEDALLPVINEILGK